MSPVKAAPVSCLHPRSPLARCNAVIVPRPVATSAIAPPSPIETKSLPTPLLDAERLDDTSCGTGAPPQRGNKKPIRWNRRSVPFYRQRPLDLLRLRKGPETPAFPDGVPFTMIRRFKWASGRAWKVNTGRRFKLYLSLKRGSRKGAK